MTVYSKPDILCYYFHRPWWDTSYELVVCGICGKCFWLPND